MPPQCRPRPKAFIGRLLPWLLLLILRITGGGAKSEQEVKDLRFTTPPVQVAEENAN